MTSVDQITAGDICCSKRPLISIERESTLKQTLEILDKHQILSAPVLDSKTNVFLGFIDVLDIAGYTASFLDEADHEEYRASEFFNQNVEEILNFSDCNYCVSIPLTCSFMDMVRTFCNPRFKGRLHRVIVHNEENEIVNIITQSDILAIIAKHLDLFQDRGETRLKESRIHHRAVSVRIDDPFIDALHLLFNNRVSGVAMVDHEYKLEGNFSASDLRGLQPSSFRLCTSSVLHFLSKGTKQSGQLHNTILCSVREEQTLAEIIRLMVEQHLHRVYVVSDSGHSEGVITIGDIIRLTQPKNPRKRKQEEITKSKNKA